MILKKLKEATREQHERLENVVDVMDASLSITGYENLIARFYRFYSAIEPKVGECDLQVLGFDFEKRRKTPLLERDLKILGIYDTIAELVPEWNDLPVINTQAAAFGCVYVLEGATLGGQIITRHLKQSLEITPDSGGAFFNSYGDQVGPMWKAFGAAITAFAENNNHDEAIINSAKDTFDSFGRCFSPGANTPSIVVAA